MSIKIMTLVWGSSTQKGSALLLLLAIADHAHDDGGGAYPSVDALARKARMTSRNVRLLLKSLSASGELVIESGAGPHGANIYTVPLKSFQAEARSDSTEATGTLPLKPTSVKPLGNRKEPKEELKDVDESFRARMRVKYAGILSDTDERIDEALGHISARKYPNKQLHVQGWLRRDAERINGGSNGRSRSNAQGDRRPREIYIIPEDADGKPILGSRPATMLPVR